MWPCSKRNDARGRCNEPQANRYGRTGLARNKEERGQEEQQHNQTPLPRNVEQAKWAEKQSQPKG